MLSMTGYGKAAGKVKGKLAQAEVRSLNSKSLELGLRLPQAYKDFEAELRQLSAEQIMRGKADLLITSDTQAAGKNSFNSAAIRQHVTELRKIAGNLKLDNEHYLQLALSQPDAVVEARPVAGKTEWHQVRKLVKQALADLRKFREQEGRALEKDLLLRVRNIKKYLAKLEAGEPARRKAVRTRLDKLMAQAGDLDVDKSRFEQELIYYLERLDITEEKIRLGNHCDYFLETMRSKNPNGKKLGFISQEIGREINTIGAKSNDAGMQRLVVMMKDELEKMKEQLANVL